MQKCPNYVRATDTNLDSKTVNTCIGTRGREVHFKTSNISHTHYSLFYRTASQG